MSDVRSTVCLIGFGEAANTFVKAATSRSIKFRGFDIKTQNPEERLPKLAEFAAASVESCQSLEDAITDVPIVLSLVTADQALVAAEDASRLITSGAIYCDMNSVAPNTKRASAAFIEAAGGSYADVAIMAPVRPASLDVPLLVSGPHSRKAVAALHSIGFSKVEIAGAAVGNASAIKMIRSVMIKGIEALSAECFIAAEAAGVTDAVISSLESSYPDFDWRTRANYALDRMMVHGLRRAAEMDEVAKTLDGIGTGATMTRATAQCQRDIGRLRASPPRGLAAKIATIISQS